VTALDHADIQGNVLVGFDKQHARYLMVRLPDEVDAARAWLADMADEVASGDAVAKGNGPDAIWTGLGLTWSGLEKLDAPDRRSALIDDYAFRVGPEARAADLGDVGSSGPSGWMFGTAARPLDAVVTVAGDDDGRALPSRVDEVEAIAARHRARIRYRIAGDRLADGNGHFGFKDGGAQPEIEGPRRDAEPGEFVLGEPSANPPRDDLPAWLRNASFQVARVLAQDVRGWRAAPAATRERWIGRTHGGARLKPLPPGSHIAKGVPDTRFDPARRRLIRRGMPYGPRFDDDPGAERGLIFVAFMASIGRQYEYVQRLWANDADFPARGTGTDPVIGARGAGYAGGASGAARYVRTRAAVYAVAPGLAGLRELAGAERHGGVRSSVPIRNFDGRTSGSRH
jgi:Dyp-type peroxidase family